MKTFKSKQIKPTTITATTEIKNFDKHTSIYFKRNGLTYVIENQKPESDVNDEMLIKSKVTIDDELNNRFFMGLDEKSKIEIQQIIDEYGMI